MSTNIDSTLINILRLAKSITVLTGARMSAESGVPTFREAQTGLWENYNPEELATPEAFEKNPKLIWDWYSWRKNMLIATRPHAGHFALVEMEKQIPEFRLITQNVDRMHQRAGNNDVIELHGNLFTARDTETGEEQSLDSFDIRENYISFRGYDNKEYPLTSIRPNIVWFGEQLPKEKLLQAKMSSENCDVFIVAGTSGQVYPAAALPQTAKENAALVIEINPEETPLTNIADYSFRGAVSYWLPALLEAVWNVQIDIDDASKYSDTRDLKYSKEVLNVIARYMALPEIGGVSFYPGFDKPIANILMDEAALRQKGKAGRNIERFRMNALTDYSESWFMSINYFSEGLLDSDLYIYAPNSSEVDMNFQHYGRKIIIVVGEEINEEQLSDCFGWQQGNGYWIGHMQKVICNTAS